MSAAQRAEVARVLGAPSGDAAAVVGCSSREPADVRRAFRHAAVLLHPDKNTLADAPAAFVKLQQALR